LFAASFTARGASLQTLNPRHQIPNKRKEKLILLIEIPVTKTVLSLEVRIWNVAAGIATHLSGGRNDKKGEVFAMTSLFPSLQG
jgi:hypothetical protein